MTTPMKSPDLFVKKQVFSLPTFTLVSGKILKDVRVGYETYGILNEKKDNVILVEHYFLGTSHVAGKYRETDLLPGYWDNLIGPGKAIDTDRYFVISTDTLVNVNANDRNTITTGPASINPDTGKPYAMDFPHVEIQDFVHLQKIMLDTMGISKLHAIVGASSGAAQALTWGAEYPNMAERIIGVVPGDIEANPYSIAILNLWMAPIMMDPNWNHGDYYGKTLPMDGIRLTIKNIVVNTYAPRWAEESFSRRWAVKDQDPQKDFNNKYAVEAFLDDTVKFFEKRYDANSLLYYSKAVQTWSIKDKIQNIKAKVLLVPSKGDLLALREYSLNAEKVLREAGVRVKVHELDSGMGHFDGIGGVDKATDVIRQFLLD